MAIFQNRWHSWMYARVARFSVVVIALFSFFAVILLLLLYYFPVFVSIKLDTTTTKHWPGYAYVMAAPDYFHDKVMNSLFPVVSDSMESPRASRLQLFENFASLGPPHSMHADIEDKGQGRFSNWNGYVVFSATDNSNPADNGRTYSVRYPLQPAWWVPWVLMVMTFASAAFVSSVSKALTERESKLDHVARDIGQFIFSIFKDSNCRYLFWAAAALMLLYMNVVFVSLLPSATIVPDSTTYLDWSPARTLGYPAFLAAYHLIFHTWRYLPVIQLNLLIVAALSLAWAVAKISKNYLSGWVFLVLIGGAGTMMFLLASDMLTEALFAAAVMSHLACIYLFLNGGKAITALSSGLFLAAAILIKSVATVILGPLVLFVIFLPARRKTLFALIFCPALAAWAVPSAYNYVHRGVFDSSAIGGFALGGYVAWGIHPRSGGTYATEAQLIERRLAPILAKRPAHFKNVKEYLDYTMNEYNILLWGNMVPELVRYYDRICVTDEKTLGNTQCWLQINKTLSHLAEEAIMNNPWQYAYQVMANYYGMWLYVFVPNQDFLANTNAIAASQSAISNGKNIHAPQLQGSLSQSGVSVEREATVTRIRNSIVSGLYNLSLLRGILPVNKLITVLNQISWLVLGLGLITSLLVFVLRWLPAIGKALCYTALTLNAYFLGTALAQPAIPRYAVPMQGVVLVLLLIVAVLIITAVHKVIIVNKERVLRGLATLSHLGERNAG